MIRIKRLFAVSAVIFSASVLCTEANAQNKFEVNGKVDMVSDYVWRGAYQSSGVSIQPSLTLSYGGLSINAWGNQSLSKDAKEFDINLGYTYKNFSAMVSDYWWSGVDKRYGDYSDSHYFEASLAYSFGDRFPLSLSWSTMFAGGDKDESGNLQGSTYISASYGISLPADITLTPSVGFTPWKGMYHHKAAFTDISLKASKDIAINNNFSIPVFIQAIASPAYDRTYLIAGISIGF